MEEQNLDNDPFVEELIDRHAGQRINKLLSVRGVTNREEFQRYLREWNANTEDEHSKVDRFSLKDAKALGLDGENRLYKPCIEFRNTILDVSLLKLKDSQTIRFYNCIICGDLTVMDIQRHLREVTLDSTIVLGNISLVGLHANTRVVCLSVNSPGLTLRQCQLDSLHLDGCTIGELHLEECACASFDAWRCHFYFFGVLGGKFAEVNFDHRQVDFACQLSLCSFLRKRRLASINVFAFPSRLDIENTVESVQTAAMHGALTFLRKHTLLKQDRGTLANVKAYEAVKYQSGIIYRCFVMATGGFVKPSYMLGWLLLIFSVCAGVYISPLSLFMAGGANEPRQLGLIEALYFSGITITTIGYGDIVPLALARIVAVAEGGFGIVLTSAFLISLVRKHIEK